MVRLVPCGVRECELGSNKSRERDRDRTQGKERKIEQNTYHITVACTLTLAPSSHSILSGYITNYFTVRGNKTDLSTILCTYSPPVSPSTTKLRSSM